MPMKKKLIEPTNKEIKMTVYEDAVEKLKTKENINSFKGIIGKTSLLLPYIPYNNIIY